MAESDDIILRLLALERQAESWPLPGPVKIALQAIAITVVLAHFIFYVSRKWPKLFKTLTTAPTAGSGINGEDLYRALLRVQNTLRTSSDSVSSPPPTAPPSPTNAAAGVLSPRGTSSS